MYGVAWRQDRVIPAIEGVVQFSLDREHRLVQLSEYIVQHFNGPCRDAGVLGRCAEVLLAEVATTAHFEPALPRQLHRLRDVILAHLRSPISTADLAHELERSPSQVRRLCQRHLGCSPGHWIKQLKMQAACEILRRTQLSMEAVAREVGFSDPFYFSRVFKKMQGLSPRTYRTQRRTL